MAHLYILKSLKEEWYYVGSSEDLMVRLSSHNKGSVRSTKARRPYMIIYSEEFKTKTEARKRELEIKKNWQLKKSIIQKYKQTAPSSNG